MKSITPGFWQIELPASFIKRFRARCRATGDGCLIYTGARTVRLPIDVDLEVEFVTPRRANYLIEHRHLPSREIRLSCHTAGCVKPEHFVEGRRRRRGTTVMDEGIKSDIRRETGQSVHALARKYGVSRNTIRRVIGTQGVKPEVKPRKQGSRLYRF